MPRGFLDNYVDRGYQRRDPVPRSIVRAVQPVFFNDIARADVFQEIFVDGGGRIGIAAPTVGVPLPGAFGRNAGMAFYGIDVPRRAEDRIRLLRKVDAEARAFHGRVMQASALN